MDKDRGKAPGDQALFAGEAWFDPIEAGLRGRIRGLIEELVEQELDPARGTSQRNAWPPQAVCPLGTRTRNPSGPAAAVPRQQAGHTTAIAPQPGSHPEKPPLHRRGRPHRQSTGPSCCG